MVTYDDNWKVRKRIKNENPRKKLDKTYTIFAEK